MEKEARLRRAARLHGLGNTHAQRTRSDVVRESSLALLARGLTPPPIFRRPGVLAYDPGMKAHDDFSDYYQELLEGRYD